MEDNLRKMFERMRAEKLSSAEKLRIRTELMTRMRDGIPSRKEIEKNRVSPFFISWNLAYSLVAILIISYGGISYFARQALPGNILYSVKTSINEPLRQALALTPEAKLRVEAEIIETRLMEIAQMNENDSPPTSENTLKVTTSVARHISEFNNILSEHENNIEPVKTAGITSRIETVLRTYDKKVPEKNGGGIGVVEQTGVSTSTPLNLSVSADYISSYWNKLEDKINSKKPSERKEISQKRLKNARDELDKLQKISTQDKVEVKNESSRDELENADKKIQEGLTALQNATSGQPVPELREAEKAVEKARLIIENKRRSMNSKTDNQTKIERPAETEDAEDSDREGSER